MSLLDGIVKGIFGGTETSSQTIEHPCTNCPSNCPIAPSACNVCRPYKERMIDAIYKVEHKSEILEQYEVTGTAAETGTYTCPHCGGPSENRYICDYCGSKLQEGSGKIQVASAQDLPNPVLDAQDLIFERFEAVKNYAGANAAYGFTDALSDIGSEGLLSTVLNALTGAASSSGASSLGNKMTEDEIEEMASYYNVSVSEYLTGLDNGKYFTMSNKSVYNNAREQYSKYGSSAAHTAGIAGLAGAAGFAGLGVGSILQNDNHRKMPVPPPREHEMQRAGREPGFGQPQRGSQPSAPPRNPEKIQGQQNHRSQGPGRPGNTGRPQGAGRPDNIRRSQGPGRPGGMGASGHPAGPGRAGRPGGPGR